MRIFISADIEGVAGVVNAQQGTPGNPEYERARRLMTQEVNAAIAGAYDGGASYVLVNDSHGPMVNLIPEELDPRAECIIGRPKAMNMAAGLDRSFDAVFFTGYHSGAGRHGVLSHTVSGFAFQALRINGIDTAEATLYGAYAGSLGVPVALLSGDDQLAEQCLPLFPGAVMVQVKTALGHRAARALSPVEARARIRAGAAKAVHGISSCAPYLIAAPHRLEADLASVAMADLCATIPAATRLAPRSVAFDCAGIVEVQQWIAVMATLCGTLR
ncbi:MAG: M55 family metallopeptidase [Acetobacteraceae bacterium]|nr:M55 family metallopeptidase [Acetobacteraceae bacterium]